MSYYKTLITSKLKPKITEPDKMFVRPESLLTSNSPPLNTER